MPDPSSPSSTPSSPSLLRRRATQLQLVTTVASTLDTTPDTFHVHMNTTYQYSTLSWSDIDHFRFFAIGTALYTFLNVLLHPVTVVKVVQQSSGGRKQPTLRSLVWKSGRGKENRNVVMNILNNVRPLYRGLPVVLSLAVPARVLYIGVLEGSRDSLGRVLSQTTLASMTESSSPDTDAQFTSQSQSALLATTLSSGIAGGLAAVAAQCLVVPMDVISQRQMLSGESASTVLRSIVQGTDGYRGLYRGFGLSIFSSLPTGTVWWAVYGGSQAQMSAYLGRSARFDQEEGSSMAYYLRKGTVQLASGISAAVVSATLTQPLDTVKTRVQVQQGTASSSSYAMVAKDLWSTSGMTGFFRGTGPRIAHMSIWGTMLSSAYELLRHVSRKDYTRY